MDADALGDDAIGIILKELQRADVSSLKELQKVVGPQCERL